MAKSKTLSQVVSNTGPLSDGTINTADISGLDSSYQAILVSGTNIKTVGGTSLLGSGDVSIGVSAFNTRTGAVTLSSSDVTTALTYTPANKAGDTFGGNVTFNAAVTANSSITLNGQLNANQILNLPGSSTSPSVFGSAATTGTTTIGGTAQTGSITIGRSTESQTINIHTGATVSGSTKTLNIGTGGVSGSTTTITIGSSSGTTTNILGTLQNGGNQVLNSSNYNSYSPTLTGTGASGTWGINISGNAATVTNGLTTSNYSSYAVVANGTVNNNIDSDWGQSFVTFDPVPSGTPPISSPNIRVINVGPDYNRRTQVAFNYATDQTWFRRKTDASWGSWREYLHSGNYNSYSPTLTGTGASGTWNITSNYANNLTQGFNSNWNTDFQQAPAGSTILRGDTSSGSSTGGPGGTWWFQQNMRHTNASNFWGVQVAWGWEDNANILRTRNVSGGSYGGWVTYLNSNNYNSYSPTLTGGGASGTWGISITGDVNKTQGTFGYSGSGLNIDVGGQGGPQVLGQGNGAAMMTFHRPGAYAINFGLGTDNQLRTGGWSRGGNFIVVDTGNYNSAINRGYFNRESNGGTMTPGYTYSVWTGGGAVGMYLPTAANSAQGDRIVILNLLLQWATNPFYVYMNTNTRLMNLNETMTCNINVGSIVLTCVYHDGTAYWNVAPGG